MDLGEHKVAPRGKNVNWVQVLSIEKTMFDFFETFKIFYWELFGFDTNHHP